MRLPRAARWSIVAAVVLVGLALGFYNFILDWQDKPYCHKQITMSLDMWMQQRGMDFQNRTGPFPNVGGTGKDSLAVIHTEMNDHMEWAKDYSYVAGLHADDPGDLVLMYFNRPTRWRAHIAPSTIFAQRKWILIPVDFLFWGSRTVNDRGECSESVSTAEFKERLRKTLDYIRAKQRPNWQTIVAEHTKFLESLDGPSP